MDGAHHSGSDCKQARFHELCRGAFGPFRSAIPSELLSLPGCHLLQEDASRVFNGAINKETVLEQIILDMTGTQATSNRDAQSASLQRTLRRTKRLLTRTNSVLLFRLVTMVIVACMLLVSVFLTWNFTRNFSGHSIRNLSFALRREILRSSLNSMVYVLTRAYTSSKTLSAMHQQAILAVGNVTSMAMRKELRSINWGFFQAEDHLSSVAFVSKDGFVTDYSRNNHIEYLYLTENYSSGSNVTWVSQTVTGSLNGSGTTTSAKSLGPFQNSFIAYLLTQKDLVWNLDTGVFRERMFSSAVPVRHPETHSFLGMSVVSSPLREVYDYVSEAGLLGGYLFFFRFNASHELALIGSSCSQANNVLTNPSSYAADVAFYLRSVYGNDSLLQKETHAEDVRLKGRRFYIDSMPLKSNFESLNLTAVLIIPRSSIMGEIDARSKTIIKVSVIAALGILVIGSILICFLTRRMSTEMQLRQELIRQLVAKHKAEQSSNYKSQFLANMSHEMRTPMAGIIGLLDLLACDTLTPDQKISVAQIRQCATGLLALVNNVLDISKIEAGKMELELTPFNLMKELESLVDMFAVQSSCSDVEVMLVFSDDFPCELKGDVTRIRQIFTNLLSNSVKFTETGHILIRGWTDQSFLTLPRKSVEHSTKEVGDVTGSRHSSSKSSRGSEAQKDIDKIALVFEVDDTGCGIPSTMQETVFDRFVQADSSTTRTHGGSGLGLYIVRSLVNMMGGEVQIVSKPGPGTRIQFHLVLETVAKGIHSHSEDALSAFISSPANHYPVEEARFPAAEILMRTHALIAMPENITKSVITYWLQKRGLIVSTVNSWDNILQTTNKLCKLECSSRMPRTMKNASCLYPESPSSPFALPSGGSSSCVSDITSKYPVLALIDISLISTGTMSNDTNLNELEDGKIPDRLNYLINSLQQLQSKSDLLIVWVTPPKTRPPLKQTLLSLLTSVVIKKPLYPSKMKWLLSLLTDLGKSEPQAEFFSYTSSNPSTPRLTGANSPFKVPVNSCSSNIGTDNDMGDGPNSGYPSTSICRDEKRSPIDAVGQHGNAGEKHVTDKFYLYDEPGCKYQSPGTMIDAVLPDGNFEEEKDGRFCCNQVFKENFVQGEPMQRISLRMYQERQEFHVEDSMSTPESLTSGLITPEDTSSIVDAGLEIRNELGSGSELQEPFIDPAEKSGIECLTREIRKNHPDVNPSTPNGESTSAGSTILSKQPAVFAGMHILLVEDTPVLQRLASMMLKKLGAEVTVVGDGLRAVEAVAQAVEGNTASAGGVKAEEGGISSEEIRSKQFDLILMDCAMPVMDGYCATRAIREAELNTGRHIPIVALTAHALASDEEKCLAVGMDAYLTKPINCKHLVSTVQSLVAELGSRNR